jgi:hypothetical protein
MPWTAGSARTGRVPAMGRFQIGGMGLGPFATLSLNVVSGEGDRQRAR